MPLKPFGVLMCVAALAFGLLIGHAPPVRVAHTRSVAEEPIILTIAGLESTAVGAPVPCHGGPDTLDLQICTIPADWPASWPATDRRFSSNCLTHLADGTLILGQGDQLLALGTDGRMRRWSMHLRGLGIDVITDCDAAPNGTVIVLSYDSIARVNPDGTAVPLRTSDTGRSEVDTVAALPDGGAIITQALPAPAVVRVGADGSMSTLIQRLSADPRTRAEDTSAADVAALPDGTFALAQTEQERVLRLTLDGRVTVLAGGGQSATPGALATDARLGPIDAIAAARDGTLTLATGRGLVAISTDGHVTPIVATDSSDEWLPTTPQTIASAGTPAAHATLRGIKRLDTEIDGTALALVSTFIDSATRVVAIGSPTPSSRLTVALPPEDRTRLPHGRAEVFASQPTAGQIDIIDHGHILNVTRINLTAGRNTVKLRIPRIATALVARVTATSGSQVATHALSFLPRPGLSTHEMRRLISVAETWGGPGGDTSNTVSHCRRRSKRTFSCHWDATADCCHSSGKALLRLRPDDLSDFIEYQGNSVTYQAVLEPR